MTSASSPNHAGSVIARAVIVGGVVGLVIGLVRGLTVYAPTAWAAAFEVAIPCAAVGLLAGLARVGLQAAAQRPATPNISEQPQRDRSKGA